MHVLLAAFAALSASQRAHVDAVVERVMQEHHVPGISLGVARDGALLYARGYGLRDVGRELAAEPATRYPVGSIAKQFAAALAMQAADSGAIALDAPLSRYFPSASPGIGRIGVGELLAQTSGIATDAGAAASPEAAVAAILQSQPSAPPGTAWIYSNANYLLVQALLQSVTGRPYGDLLRQRIVEPLGMTATSYGPAAATGDTAAGYAWHGGWVPASAGAARAFEAGDVTSNVFDLLRWLEALRSGRIADAAGFSTMTTSAKLIDGTPTHYGFGFFLPDWFGYRAIEHPGYVDGFSAEDAMLLDDGLQVAILSNLEAVDLTPLVQSVVAAIDPPRDLNLVARPNAPPQNENARITAALRAIVGTQGFASLGPVESIEFVERSAAGGVTSDKYRVTFSNGPWWVTIAYRQDGSIEALTLTPVE